MESCRLLFLATGHARHLKPLFDSYDMKAAWLASKKAATLPAGVSEARAVMPLKYLTRSPFLNRYP